jgi:two-component sensor histidine kinase
MREQHVRILMTEVDHRSKNLLAVVQAIARQTVSSTPTAGEFEQKFSARLLGLAASQHLLTEQQWSGVRLDALVRSQISHYSELIRRRIHVAGPDILLDSAATQALGMALHELATNAAKYGALSNDIGHIAVTWRIEASGAEPMLEMEWIEREGPSALAPRNPGFGITIIERMLAQRLNAEARLSFEKEGLVWRLRVALKYIEPGDGLEEKSKPTGE